MAMSRLCAIRASSGRHDARESRNTLRSFRATDFRVTGWCLLGLVVCAFTVCNAFAQNFPTKVVRYVVPFTGGSGADTLARIIVPGMGQVLGQQVVVENRGGAAGNIGAEFAARAPADGYTLMQAGMPLAANMSLYKNLS